MELSSDVRAAQRRIVAQLATIGLTLPGTLLHRYARCGKTQCRCHADPPTLHGPWWSWTRKINGKTVTIRLTDDRARAYQPWFDNARRLRGLAAELDRLALSIVDQHQPPHT